MYFFNSGNGTFAVQKSFPAGDFPYSVAAADVNGDNKTDIIVANYGGNSVGVLFNTADGMFKTQSPYSTGSASNPTCVTVADVNGDNELDIIVSDSNANNIGVLFNVGEGMFGNTASYSSASNPNSVAVADVNNDTMLDIIVANSDASNVGVLFNNGSGLFNPQTTYSTSSNPYCVWW